MIIFSSFGFRNATVVLKMKAYLPEPGNKKVLIIPFAGFSSENTGMREREGLVSFGFEPSNLFVLTESNAADMRNIPFDYIYVPGGNPFKLLSELQSVGFLDDIKRMAGNGSDYIGVSAGAMLAVPDMAYASELGEQRQRYPLVDHCGLGLVDAYVICHVDQLNAESIRTCKAAHACGKWLEIRNDDVMVIGQ